MLGTIRTAVARKLVALLGLVFPVSAGSPVASGIPYARFCKQKGKADAEEERGTGAETR
jgi:hypothetical protein